MSEQTTPPSGDEAPKTDPQVEAFDELCRRLGGFAEHVHTEWVDGYLTAIAASWRPIGLAEVLPRMMDDAFERAHGTPSEQEAALAVMQARLDVLRLALDAKALLDDSESLRLGPLMQEWTEQARADLVSQNLATEEEAAQLHTGADWAMGFLAAVDDFSEDWPAPDEDKEPEAYELYEQLLECVGALAMDPASDAFKSFAAKGWKDADPTRDELVDEACFAIQDLRLWWLDNAPKPEPRRVEALPGRNDPCFCGSGKKYKKCHGA